MNQNNNNNNIIGYDSQTGQPIYANQNTNIQQSIQQPQMNTVYTQQPVQYQQMQQPLQTQPSKNNNSNKIIIIITIVIIVTILGIILFLGLDKKKPVNNENTNNLETENNNNHNNNNQNNELQNNNSIGIVEEGTNTSYDENGAFLFSIEDVFFIIGKGTIVNGQVLRGKIKIGEPVQIVGLNDEILTSEVIGIEKYREEKDEALVGDSVGIILKDISREQIKTGQVLAKPNSIVAATKFDADIKILSKEEIGRNIPFSDEFEPQFYFRITDIIGKIILPNNIEMIRAGEEASITVNLTTNVAMEEGTEFSIREGGMTIGYGVVTKIY